MGEDIPNLADNSYLSDVDRRTLSEDVAYRQEILERHPTVFIRPDDRTAAARPLYVHADEQGVSYLGLVTEHGSHSARKPPVHAEPRIRIRIMSREPKIIAEITKEEFANAYTSIYDQESAIVWLEQKYPNRKFSGTSTVTVYRVQYE